MIRLITVTLLFLTLFSCSNKTKLTKKQFETWYLSIEKTPCFGTCGTYLLKISADGILKLDAKRFLDIEGDYSSVLNADSTLSLINQVESLKWTQYAQDYLTGYSDLPSTILCYSKTAGDTTWLRYEGDKAPEEVMRLGKKLELIQKTTEWKSVEAD